MIGSINMMVIVTSSHALQFTEFRVDYHDDILENINNYELKITSIYYVIVNVIQ